MRRPFTHRRIEDRLRAMGWPDVRVTPEGIFLGQPDTTAVAWIRLRMPRPDLSAMRAQYRHRKRGGR